jgi:TetR/AcrR family transcriptional repressor of nem operon
MGHSRAAKQDTHSRIVAVASKRLRQEGFAGVGVADVMHEAGLTVGGFYKHFASRDDLLREALDAACGAWRARKEDAAAGGPPMTYQLLVDEYLSVAHRDNPGAGCPVAAVAADVGRADEETRALFNQRIDQNIDLLASLIPTQSQDPSSARAQAILTYSALVGAVTIARVAPDEALSREILETVRDLLLTKED